MNTPGKKLRGKEGEFRGVFETNHLPLFRFAYRLTGSVADAEDIVQACFLTLLQPECAYDSERSPLRAYLFGVVRNLAARQLRQREIGGQGDLETADHQSPENEFLRAELGHLVAKAVVELPLTQREVLVLAHYEQLPLSEIAEILCIEIGAVKSRLQRARASLKEKLAAYAPVRRREYERSRIG